MSIAPGTHLGAYEVLSLIGAGGMGEVYRARDSKLNRDVALKVLPDSFANDPDRLARFQREAQVLASLNHPNIGGIYGLEETDPSAHSASSGQAAVRALVLELVEGPTLADRLAQGPIPVDEALPIAKQIAEALEAAHEHGVIHRDLKPANVKLRPDGTVKVLDFGLAKAFAPDSASATVGDLSPSPTISTPAATRMGVIMGTAAYMSPEQARGKPVDKRADIWAFGCVLYEMLTGKRAFEGDDVSDTLAAILRGEPDWAGLPAETTAPIRKLLRRCVEKDRKRRLADIADARFEIDEALIAPVSDAGSTAAASWTRIRPFWVATLALVAGTLVGGSLKPGSAPSRPVTRFTVALPATQRLTPASRWGLALSPNGAMLVYVANNQLYLRFMDRQDAQPLPGTENAKSPFFSPDGQWVGFVGGPNTNQLKRVAINGGAPIIICDLPGNVFGAHWERDDTILYGYFGGIWKVSAVGGTPERLIALDASKNEWAAGPELLARGNAILFRTGVGSSPSVTGQIVAQPLSSGSRRVLIDRSLRAIALPTGPPAVRARNRFARSVV